MKKEFRSSSVLWFTVEKEDSSSQLCWEDVTTFCFLQLIFTSHSISVLVPLNAGHERRMFGAGEIYSAPSCHSQALGHKWQKSTEVCVHLCSVWAKGQMKHLHYLCCWWTFTCEVRDCVWPLRRAAAHILLCPLYTPPGNIHLHVHTCHCVFNQC